MAISMLPAKSEYSSTTYNTIIMASSKPEYRLYSLYIPLTTTARLSAITIFLNNPKTTL